MRIGAHVSAAGGVWNAPEHAAAIGCEVFQVFTRPPQGGKGAVITDSTATQLRAAMKKYKQEDFVIHTPYYINFASTTPRIRYGSISVVREELERGSKLGASYVMTHLGSTKDAGPTVGLHKTWRGIQRILDGYRGTTQLLLEISAGGGDSVGDSFEELAFLINNAEKKKPYKGKIGVCWDTCHLFAAGYDIRTRETVSTTVKLFTKVVGITRLKLCHANDSLFDLSAHRDRHEHIGKGKIGIEGFRALLQHPKMKNVDMIVETPFDEKRANDIKTLKRLRK